MKKRDKNNNIRSINKQREILFLEKQLGVSLCKSYKKFLIEHRNPKQCIINGLPILGLFLNFGLTSVIGATAHLRKKWPDLPKSLMPIRLLDVRALCLDLENGSSDDAPLVEVNLEEKDTPPVQIHPSFKEYIEGGEKTKRRIQEAFEQIRKCREDTERKRERKFEHLKSVFHPRAEDWRPVRSCIHDEVVGLCALKYDPLKDALLVTGFIATDHPNYEEGHGIRNLALIVLSDAYKTGSPMRMIFGKAIFDRNGIYRRSQPQEIPNELVRLAGEYGISFANSHKGEILPEKAISLYGELLEIPSEAKQNIDKFQGTGLSLQAFCYIIASNLWTKEEAIWILLNHPRPEGILIGKDLPEDRLFYLESLSYGRAALAVSRLKQKILTDLEEKFPDDKEKIYCTTQVKERFWILKASHDFNLPWIVNNLEIIVRAKQPILVLARPYPKENSQIINPKMFKGYLNKLKYFDLLKKEKMQNSVRILLGSEELRDSNDLKKISEKFRKKNVHLALPSFSCKELDEEVDKRMAKARLIRK